LAVWVAGRVRPPGYVGALTQALVSDGHEEVVFGVANTLLQANPRGLRQIPLKGLRTARHSVNRAAAAWLAGKMRITKAVPILMTFLQSTREEPRVRGEAAEALGSIGDRRAVIPLISALADPAPEVRFWAAFALGRIGDERAVPHLRIRTSDSALVPPMGSVGQEARDALASLGALESDS
jgi:HEAT repeat protein